MQINKFVCLIFRWKISRWNAVQFPSINAVLTQISLTAAQKSFFNGSRSKIMIISKIEIRYNQNMQTKPHSVKEVEQHATVAEVQAKHCIQCVYSTVVGRGVHFICIWNKNSPNVKPKYKNTSAPVILENATINRSKRLLRLVLDFLLQPKVT